MSRSQTTASEAERLASWAPARRALSILARDEEWINARHVEFTSIVAPTFEERARAEYFRQIGRAHV